MAALARRLLYYYEVMTDISQGERKPAFEAASIFDNFERCELNLKIVTWSLAYLSVALKREQEQVVIADAAVKNLKRARPIYSFFLTVSFT